MKLVNHIPNTLTVLRLLLCPATLYCFLTTQYVWGLVLYVLACSTDFFDGYLARKLNSTSPLGSILDPIADKLTILAFFALLMSLGACPAWFLGLFIAISLLQCMGLCVIKAPTPTARLRIEPLRVGKWNTVLQFVWIGIVFADIFLRYRFPRNFHFSPAFYLVGYGLLGISQIVVFFRYFFHYRSVLVPDLRASAAPS